MVRMNYFMTYRGGRYVDCRLVRHYKDNYSTISTQLFLLYFSTTRQFIIYHQLRMVYSLCIFSPTANNKNRIPTSGFPETTNSLAREITEL